MQRSGRLITPQAMVDDEAAFMSSHEYRAAELVIRNLAPLLQSIQNALDLQLQLECGFMKRNDMKLRFESFYAQMAEELKEQQTDSVEPTPDVADPGQAE